MSRNGMSSPSLHESSDGSAEVTHRKDAHGEGGPTGVRITVTVANRYTFDKDLVTGRQIKEAARVPPGFALYRRTPAGNEPIADDAQIELHNGDHFFARPSPAGP
jgi:hypothetical protein